jgi:hypothetical protein
MYERVGDARAIVLELHVGEGITGGLQILRPDVWNSILGAHHFDL